MEKQAVTSLLIKWGEGDKAALDELLPVVYEELRRMAKKKLRGESSGNSLQPTALVHEAYLKLSGLENPSFENRARFFALSATVMRNVLVDHARHHIAAKRGGGIKVSELEFHVADELLDDVADLPLAAAGQLVQGITFG